MSDKDLSYYETHPEELTDEIATTLMMGGKIEGDTEAAEEATEESGEAPAAEQQESEEEPVVLAKDGKHTIPYEELERARSEAKQWEQTAKEKDALIEQLKSAQAKDAEEGTTAATDDLIASMREDYPSLADAVQALVDSRVTAAVEAVTREIEPLRQRVENKAVEDHFAAIRGAHKDFDDIVSDNKLMAWVESLPTYARSGAQSVLEQGTAQEVIDLLNDYKATLTKPAEVPSSKEDIANKAEQAISKATAKAVVPSSLSDLPSGGAPASEELGAYENMGDSALMSAFMKMDPAKLNERLARLL